MGQGCPGSSGGKAQTCSLLEEVRSAVSSSVPGDTESGCHRATLRSRWENPRKVLRLVSGLVIAIILITTLNGVAWKTEEREGSAVQHEPGERGSWTAWVEGGDRLKRAVGTREGK